MALLLLSFLAASGCDGDGSDSTETPTQEPPAQTTAPPTASPGPGATPNIYVTPDVATVTPLLVSGCDNAWETQDFPSKNLRLCFPSDWAVDECPAQCVLLNLSESEPVGLNVHQPDPAASLECDEPAPIDTAIGTVDLCTTEATFAGRSHHLLLPNRVVIFVFVGDQATEQERADAFRVAMSVEVLP